MHKRRFRPAETGQALVETVLVLPLVVLILTGIIVFGMGIFYQQQVANIAREAARYAAIHSATSSDCPVRGWRDYNPALVPAEITITPLACEDEPDETPVPWPSMHAHARGFAFGLNPNDVHLTACWSGWWEGSYPGGSHDAGPTNATTGDPNIWVDCTMEGGITPVTETGDLNCPSHTVDGDDTASHLATSSGATANRVTVYACYVWTPPMAGFLGIPQSITMRAVINEAVQHQR